MKDFQIIVGGKAGDGIQQAGLVIAGLLNAAGYYSFMYYDYPSLIRGGHNFAVVRASDKKISAIGLKADMLIALNDETIALHRGKLKDPGMVIYDSGNVKTEKGCPVAVDEILSSEDAPDIMKNSCLAGAFAKAAGISEKILDETIRKNAKKQTELNLKIARGGFSSANKMMAIEPAGAKPLPLINGNEATGLGLIDAGIEAYFAYPMTPASGLLHFLAGAAEDYGIKVVHPESEIAVMLMALGSSYAGAKTAVGTSGGGFCLMTEGLSMAGMAELPVVIVLGQRTGPSTGIPTYTCQSELFFALYSGHGEFPRIVAAPGDAEEAFYLSASAMNLACRHQVPAIILTDKFLCEGVYSFDIDKTGAPYHPGSQAAAEAEGPYKRYLFTPDGISPVIKPGVKDKPVKVNSYEHDEYGITTEEAELTVKMQDKRLGKEKYIAEDIENNLQAVRTGGKEKASAALVCWGSNKGVAEETADMLGLRLVRPLIMSPFPKKQMEEALSGAEKIICIENNATGQLAALMEFNGIKVHSKILKYDGRPFFTGELHDKIKEVI